MSLPDDQVAALTQELRSALSRHMPTSSRSEVVSDFRPQLQSQVQEYERAIGQHYSELQDELGAVRSKLEAEKGSLSAMQGALDRQKAAIGELKNRINARSDEELRALERDTQVLISTFRELEGVYLKLKVQIVAVEFVRSSDLLKLTIENLKLYRIEGLYVRVCEEGGVEVAEEGLESLEGSRREEVTVAVRLETGRNYRVGICWKERTVSGEVSLRVQ